MRKLLVASVSSALLVGAVLWVHPTEAWRYLSSISVKSIIMAASFLVLSLMVNAIRFRRLLCLSGYPLGWRTALRAFMAGNVGSLFVFPIIGQAGARQVILEKNGIPAEVNASLMVVERGATACMSATIALLALADLSGYANVEKLLSSIRVYPMAVAFVLTLLLLVVLRKKPAKAAIEVLLAPVMIARAAEIGFWTLLQLVAMVGSFACLAYELAPSLGRFDLLAASFIVSFCGSIPISIGGWGVREISAIWIFGTLGMSPGQALAVTIAAGVLWLALVVVCAAIVLTFLDSKPLQNDMPSCHGVPRRASSLLTTMAVPMLGVATLLYQFHITFPLGNVNLNLADPFAMLSLVILGANCFKDKSLPKWQINQLNLIFAAFGVLMLYGFAVYCVRTGSWASASLSRVFGWSVLLGYCAMGSLFVKSLGFPRGCNLATTILECSAAAIIGVELMYRWLFLAGILTTPPPLNFEGFSANRNAFVFAVNLLICLSLARWGGVKGMKNTKDYFHSFAIALFVSVVLLSGSRTGIAVVVLVFCSAVHFKMQRLQDLAILSVLALVLWGLILLVSAAFATVGQLSFLEGLNGVQAPLSNSGSDFSRAEINLAAWELFKVSPWFGQGLGGFLNQSLGVFGYPLGIHNTWLWILVDFGLVGCALTSLIVFRVGAYVFRGRLWRSTDRYQVAFVLGLICFGLFSQFHEVSFQRIMWFCMGLLLAVAKEEPSV